MLQRHKVNILNQENGAEGRICIPFFRAVLSIQFRLLLKVLILVFQISHSLTPEVPIQCEKELKNMKCVFIHSLYYISLFYI